MSMTACPTCQSPTEGGTCTTCPQPSYQQGYPQPVVLAPTTQIVMGNRKDPLLAAILGFLFGPLGLLYSTVTGALVMFLVNVVIGLVTLGFGLIITWPICAVVGWVGANNANSRMNMVSQPGVMFAPQPAMMATPQLSPQPAPQPAGWYPDPTGQAGQRYWDGSTWTAHTS